MTGDGMWVMAIAATPLVAWPISIAYVHLCHPTASLFGWLADRGEEVAGVADEGRMAAAVRRRVS